MRNSFFKDHLNTLQIKKRLLELEGSKVGFYSVGLYPASLAYNCAMQNSANRLLLAPRPGRDLLGAFPKETLDGMDSDHVSTLFNISTHIEGGKRVNNNISDLILRCDLLILSSNSNHVQDDLSLALKIREDLNRTDVVIACLAGSFCHDKDTQESFVLCQKVPNLAFFSGFHRHGALRNPLDSFTANFTHPDALTAMIGARLLDGLSPNIQVSSGVHNIEGQYIKAAKNMSSIFAGFGFEYHKNNAGLLPTLLTLLLEQCLDQAATVSMNRDNRTNLYECQPFSLTELGYGVQKIEAALLRDGDMQMVRDHTFAQLTAMVADVRGSMMYPLTGSPTRNFQAGQVLAINMRLNKRCPKSIEEFIQWCESDGLKEGALEGLKSLKFWPSIIKEYSIPLNDSSMVNLLYLSLYGSSKSKQVVYNVMTQSRELTSFCQESVRPTHSRHYNDAFNNLNDPASIDLIVRAVYFKDKSKTNIPKPFLDNASNIYPAQDYIKAMNLIEQYFTK